MESQSSDRKNKTYNKTKTQTKKATETRKSDKPNTNHDNQREGKTNRVSHKKHKQTRTTCTNT